MQNIFEEYGGTIITVILFSGVIGGLYYLLEFIANGMGA